LWRMGPTFFKCFLFYESVQSIIWRRAASPRRTPTFTVIRTESLTCNHSRSACMHSSSANAVHANDVQRTMCNALRRYTLRQAGTHFFLKSPTEDLDCYLIRGYLGPWKSDPPPKKKWYLDLFEFFSQRPHVCLTHSRPMYVCMRIYVRAAAVVYNGRFQHTSSLQPKLSRRRYDQS